MIRLGGLGDASHTGALGSSSGELSEGTDGSHACRISAQDSQGGGLDVARQFWGSGNNVAAPGFNASDQATLEVVAGREFPAMLRQPYSPASEISRWQHDQLAEIIRLAFDNTALYRHRLETAGLRPDDYRSLDDLLAFPVTSKEDFLQAYPTGCLSSDYRERRTFKTWCSGSSGVTLPVRFDLASVITDTLHGARQLILQSDGAVERHDLTLHYYTYPWWTGHIAGEWRSAFVSTLVAPHDAARIARDERPQVLTGYPSVIERLVGETARGELDLKLIVTNSEQSSRFERDRLSDHFQCPVLDEYSSEELTRIALEMPDGFYYVHEDSVFLEVLDAVTRDPVPDGEWGEAVVTGLLNRAMPFIRYATGDFVKRPKRRSRGYRGLGWAPLEAIGGRVLDSFIRRDGTIVPAGLLLDVIYRAMADNEIDIEQYSLTQAAPDHVQIAVRPARWAGRSRIPDFVEHVHQLLSDVLGAKTQLEMVQFAPAAAGEKAKRRPIRRSFAGASSLTA